MSNFEFRRKLIYDLGMHRGLDTKFYIDKGFDVVALEANPAMIAVALENLGPPRSDDRLHIVKRALWQVPDTVISFYVNNNKDDWSSVIKNWAEKDGNAATEIKVETITLPNMFDQYGVPYYLKCDIEGADEIMARQLLADKRRPAFVSIEAHSLEALALLYSAGYDRVQIVNQAFHPYTQPPNPPREGAHVPVRFNGHMSGLFGLELDPAAWVPFSQAAENYLQFRWLKQRDQQLAHGWLDFHVTSSATLGTLLQERAT